MTERFEGDWPDVDLQREEDRMIKRLIEVCRRIILVGSDELIGELEVAVDDVESMFESNDPRSMGWVGDDGLP